MRRILLVSLVALTAALIARAASAAPPTPTPIPATTTSAPSTGVAAVDATLKLMVARDSAGLADRAHFTPRGCVAQRQIGDPPQCAPGQPVGTQVPTFSAGSCEGGFITTKDAVQSYFASWFAKFNAASVYAVFRADPSDFLPGNYVVALTGGSVASPTAPVSMWWLTTDGTITGMLLECGPTGAQGRVDFFAPNPAYVLGPLNQCTASDPATVDFDMTSISGGVFTGFISSAEDVVNRTPPGERYIVQVTGDTRFTGTVANFNDLRVGEHVSVSGTRQFDCTIVASTIGTPTVPVPQMQIEPASGPCNGIVTLSGQHFPGPAVVAFKFILPNSDVFGQTIDSINVDESGAFTAQVTLGDEGCRLAALSRSVGGPGWVTIAADQQNQPVDASIYAQVHYQTLPVRAPNTGSGPESARQGFVLLAMMMAGAGSIAVVGAMRSRRHRRDSSLRPE